jgi:TrmH family RNA methyltransferase
MSTVALARARSLHRSKHRRELGLFLAEGPHLVEEALLSGAPLVDVLVAHEALVRPGIKELLDRVRASGADVHSVRTVELDRAADTTTPQGILAVGRIPAPNAERASAAGGWLVLDGVQDPGNVGTLLRACDAFALTGVVTGKGTADPWGPKVVRAGQGAHFRLEIVTGDDPAPTFLDAFAAQGGAIWAAELAGDDVYTCDAPPERFALLLGSEAHGLGSDLLARADRRVCVPQPGVADSLNVAMAGVVLLSFMTHARGAAR